MKLWTHLYELNPLVHLNSRHDRSPKPGALIKAEFTNGSVGYSDYHPWRELKGCSLFEKLQYIRKSRNADTFQHSLAQARMDAQFREENRSGFDFFRHIKLLNHYLIPDIKTFPKLKLLELEAQGYCRFKVKMGRSLRVETIKLKELCLSCGQETLFRLDFNESLGMRDFRLWLDRNPDLLKKIEFIEDPIPFKPFQWAYLSKEYPICLALDMAANPLEVDPSLFKVLILKPTIQNVKKIMEKYAPFDHPLVLTHSMDHLIGRSIAGWWACWAKEHFGSRVIECGLQCRGIFEEDSSLSPKFIPPKGLGWGFDELLGELNWVEL